MGGRESWGGREVVGLLSCTPVALASSFNAAAAAVKRFFPSRIHIDQSAQSFVSFLLGIPSYLLDVAAGVY